MRQPKVQEVSPVLELSMLKAEFFGRTWCRLSFSTQEKTSFPCSGEFTVGSIAFRKATISKSNFAIVDGIGRICSGQDRAKIF